MSLLSVSDVARVRGWHRVTGWRWLRRVEREHGAKLVRQGRTLYIERSELARIVALLPKPMDPRIVRLLRSIQERLDAIESRQNGFANDLQQLRRAAGL